MDDKKINVSFLFLFFTEIIFYYRVELIFIYYTDFIIVSIQVLSLCENIL